MINRFKTITQITLTLIYLVIIAGAVVRMTGSGMGCPDWPKCFGYYIPPTEVEQLLWQPNKAFKKGQVIIVDETLLVAKTNFTTSEAFNQDNWKPYTKHDYAVFNPIHTWVEYINRLLGALAGLSTLAMGIFSVGLWKKNKSIPLLSWLAVFGMGFQAWLGATVVYSVLAPVRITLHMVMALLIVALLIYIVSLVKNISAKQQYDPLFSKLLLVALVLTMLQVILGTQVRQFVDEQIDSVGETAKNLWLAMPNVQFYIHRSFSIAVLALNGFLLYRNRKLRLGYKKLNWVLALIGLEVLTGMAMYYIDFPFGTQALHLVLASLLFGVQFYLVLEAKKAKTAIKSL